MNNTLLRAPRLCRQLGTYFFLLGALVGLPAWAQQGRPAGVPEAGPLPGATISGRVIDSASGQPVPFSTVSVLRAADSTLVGGGLVDENGRYTLERLAPGNYLLKVNFLGYRTAWQRLALPMGTNAPAVPPIRLSQATARLGEVVVEAERPVFTLGIDRKTFDVARSNLNPGGTATDVLANVPTVTVDVDGNVSMRNNENVTIYIDGRPSGITASNRAAVLRQIPAAAIDRIELITSPSARYDAEGTAGIINIILKKNKLEGLNGSVQASVGTRQKYNALGNVAYRNAKVNAYLNYNFRYYSRFLEGNTERFTFARDSASGQLVPALNTFSSSRGISEDRSHFVKGGIDFFLPKDHTLGVSAGINHGYSWYGEPNDYLYVRPGLGGEDTSRAARPSRNNGFNRNLEAALTHVKKYNTKGWEWSSQVAFSDFSTANTINVRQLGRLEAVPGTEFLNTPYQSNPVGNITQVLTAQTDYVRPLNERQKLEWGAKTNLRRIESRQSFFAGADPAALAEIPNQRNDFDYDERIVAGYGIWQQQLGAFGFQAGMRYEHTFIRTRFSQVDTVLGTFNNLGGNRNYGNWVPSVNLNYKLSATQEVQLNGTVRLNRPGPGSLNPFTDYADPNSIRRGNPALNPETIYAAEANWLLNLPALTLTSTGFYRYTQDFFTRLIEVGADGRATVTEVNAGRRQDAGAEFVGRWQIAKGYSLTGNTSVFYSNIQAPNLSIGLARQNYNYSFRLMGNAQVRKQTNLQLTGWYRSPFIMPQGQSVPMYSVDLAASQEFWRRKATFSLAVNDVFNTLRFGMQTSDVTFRQRIIRKRETQILTATLAYRFGSMDNLSRRRDTRNPGGMGGGGDFGGF